MANERVLVTFEGRDKGLVSTARNAAEAVRRVQNDLERLRKRAPTLNIFQNSLTYANRLLANLKAQKDAFDQMIQQGYTLSRQEQQRYELLEREIRSQAKVVNNLNKIIRLRNEENIKWEQQLQIAKQIQSLEARSAAARDPGVTRARIAAEADRRRQDEIVSSSVDSLLGNQGVFSAISGFVTGGQSAASVLAVLQNALSGFSVASVAAAGAVGVLGLQIKTLQVGLQGLIKVFQAAAAGVGAYVRLIGNVITLQTRAVTTVGGFVKRLWDQYRAFRDSRREIEQSNGAIRAYGNNLRGLVGTVNNLNRGINIFGASIRQIGQAIQNAGVLLTIYFSLPASQLLKGITDVSLELNDVLVEIQKNTGLATESIQGFVRDGIEALSSLTPTGIVDIAQIVSDAAKSGVPTDFLIPFTRVIDQLAVATDITADRATTAIARIVNIFYDLETLASQGGDEFIKTINGIGSAIAVLGQENSLFESEIVSATLRLAPAARALRLEVFEALALAATVVSTSASAERAGTQAGALLVALGVDIEKFANAVGLSEEALSDLIDQDAIGVLNQYANIIANLSSNTQRLAAQNELAGRVGGKAFGNLTSGSDDLIKNLSLAEEAFVKGIALQLEFDRATNSVANQTKILGNNLRVLGVTLGDAVLPQITEAVTYVIPLVQALTQYIRDFAAASEEASLKIRLWVVGLIAALAVLGPISYALGSLLFQIGIFTTGFTGLVALIGRAVSGPLALAGALLSLLTPLRATIVFMGLATAAMIYFGSTSESVAAGVVTVFRTMGDFVIGVFTNIIVSIQNFFTTVFALLTDFLRGFARAIQNFGIFTETALAAGSDAGRKVVEGLEDGADGAEDAGKKIGEEVGKGVQEGIKESTYGTLEDVRNLAQGFGDAFRSGLRGLSPEVLDVFDDVFSTASSVFTQFASYFSLDQTVVSNELQNIANILLGTFSSVGEQIEKVGGIFEGLRPFIGGFADDLQKLYDATVDYNRAQEQLINLQKQLKGFDRDTANAIAAITRQSDLTVTERANRIRNLKQERAREKIALQDQIEDQEEVVENTKEEVNAQQQLIRVLEKLIPQRESIAPDKPIDPDTVIGTPGDLVLEQTDAYNELNNAISGVNETFETFADSVKRTRDFILGFLSGLLNENLFVEGYEPVWEEFFKGWERGEQVREDIEDWFTKQTERFDNFKKAINSVGNVLSLFAAGVQSGFTGVDVLPEGKSRATLSAGEFAAFASGLAIGNTGTYLDKLFETVITEIFGDQKPGEALSTKLEESLNAFLGALLFDTDIVTSVDRIADAIEIIVTNLGKLAGYSFDNMPVLAISIASIMDNVLEGTATFIEFVAAASEIISFLTGSGTEQGLLDALSKLDKSNTLYNNLVSNKRFADSTGQSQIKTLNFAALGTITGNAINQFLANVFNTINTQGVSDVASAIINFLLGVIGSIDPVEIGNIFSIIPNTIIDALDGIDQNTISAVATNLINSFLAVGDSIKFKDAIDILFRIANGIAVGLADADWTKLTGPLNEIASSILQGLAEFNWSSLGTGIANIVSAIVDAIDDPELWANAGIVFGNLVNTVVQVIDELQWSEITFSIFDNFVTMVLSAMEAIEWMDVFLTMKGVFEEAAVGFADFLLSNFLSLIGLGRLNRTLLGTGRTGEDDPIAPTAMGIPPPDVRLSSIFVGNLSDEDQLYLEGYLKALRLELITGLLESINPVNWFKNLFGGKEDELPSEAKNSGAFQKLTGFVGGLFGLGGSQEVADETVTTFNDASTIASPQILTQAMALGGTAGDGFRQGFSDQVDTDNSWASAIYNGLVGWTTSNSALLNAAGLEVFELVSDAISVEFNTSTSYLNSIRLGLASWIAENQTKLNGYGGVIADRISDGVQDGFESNSPFEGLLTALRSFIVTYGGQIFESFYNLGRAVWGGFLDGISDNIQGNIGDYFNENILDSIINPATPASVTGAVGERNYDGYAPFQQASTGQAITLNFYVNGSTAKDTEELANQMMKLLEKRIRFSR